VLAEEDGDQRIDVSGSVITYQNLSTDPAFENGSDRETHFGRRLAQRNEIDTSFWQRPLSHSFTDESGEIHIRGPTSSDGSCVVNECHGEDQHFAAIRITIRAS
jgi:hypothetical protein